MGAGAIARTMLNGQTPGGAALPPPTGLIGVLPPDMWFRKKKAFFQPFQVLDLAAAETDSATIRADTEHDWVFFVASLKLRSNDNLTDRDGTPVTVTLSDESNQSYMGSNGTAADVETVFGSAKQPAILAVPIIVRAGTGLVIKFTNLHNANALNVRGLLVGWQVSLSNT